MLFERLAASVVCGLLLFSAVRAEDGLRPGEAFKVRSSVLPYTEGAIFVMPGELIPLAMTAPASRRFVLKTPEGAKVAATANRWTWEAPTRPGRYDLEIENQDGEKVVDFSAFVMVPGTGVRNGVLNGFQIGDYPEKPLNGNLIYVPPRGFIEVTRETEDTRVSPHFRIKQFLTKQKSDYPKYLVLDERLIYALEVIGSHLEGRGWDAGDIFVMSGYRTPYYNKQLDDTKYSLHQWGKAADIFLDKDNDGLMDDFNKDDAIDRRDAVALAEMIERLLKGADLSAYIGGIGIYGATSAHGPFVHVDTRPWKARW
jgi:hypothetical protein